MAEQFLDVLDTGFVLQQMQGAGMAQAVKPEFKPGLFGVTVKYAFQGASIHPAFGFTALKQDWV